MEFRQSAFDVGPGFAQTATCTLRYVRLRSSATAEVAWSLGYTPRKKSKLRYWMTARLWRTIFAITAYSFQQGTKIAMWRSLPEASSSAFSGKRFRML